MISKRIALKQKNYWSCSNQSLNPQYFYYTKTSCEVALTHLYNSLLLIISYYQAETIKKSELLSALLSTHPKTDHLNDNTDLTITSNKSF